MIRLALASFALLAFAAACGGDEEVFTFAGESYTEDELRQETQEAIDANGFQEECGEWLDSTPEERATSIAAMVVLGAIETIEEATRAFAIITDVCVERSA